MDGFLGLLLITASLFAGYDVGRHFEINTFSVTWPQAGYHPKILKADSDAGNESFFRWRGNGCGTGGNTGLGRAMRQYLGRLRCLGQRVQVRGSGPWRQRLRSGPRFLECVL